MNKDKNPYFSIFKYLSRNKSRVIPIFIIFSAAIILLTITLTIIFSITYTIYYNKNYLKSAIFIRTKGIEYKFIKDKINFNDYIKNKKWEKNAFIVKELFKRHPSIKDRKS